MARDLKLQVILDAVDKATGPLKKITQGSGKTAEALKASREQLRQLERQQKDLSSFRKLKSATRDNSEALAQAQERMRNLRTELKATKAPTEQFQQKFLKAQHEVERLNSTLGDQRRRLGELRTSLRAGGTSTDDLTGSEKKLAGQIRQANEALETQKRRMNEVTQAQKKAQQAADRYQRGLGRANTMRSAGFTGLATGGAATAMITAQAFQNQASGARLAAQTGGGAQQADKYRENIRSVYSGGRGGSLENVEQAIGAVNSTFNRGGGMSDAQLEAASARALAIQEAFGSEAAENIQIASIMVNNRLAADSEEAFNLITRAYQNVSANMRDELPEILHEYSTNFRALGFDGKEALNLLVAAADQGKFALDKTGDALKEFTIRGSDMSKASVTAYESIGLNAQQMSDAIAAGGPDARKAMQQTAQAILAIPEPARRANLAIALFGTPIEDLSVDQIPKFLEALGGTQDRLGQVKGATDEMATTLDDNASKALTNIQRALSGVFMGVLGSVQDEIIGTSKALVDWIKEHPHLVEVIAKAVAVLAGLLAVGGAMTIMWASMIGPIVTARFALNMLGIKTGGLGGKIYSLTSKILPALGKGLLAVSRGFLLMATSIGKAGIALLANPMTWIILGIVAAVAVLAGAAYLVYKNWGAISEWFSQRWQDVKAAFDGGIAGISRLILDWSPLGLLQRGITSALSALGIEVPEQFKSLGGTIIDGLIGGLFGKLGELKNSVVGIADSVTGWFKDKLDIHSPSRVFAALGGHTVDGLTLGLERQRDDPAKSITDIAKRAKQAGAGLALGAMALPAAAMPSISAGEPIRFDSRPPLSSQAAAPGYQDNSTSHYTITINTPPGSDEHAIAKAVSRELDRRDRERSVRQRSSMWDRD